MAMPARAADPDPLVGQWHLDDTYRTDPSDPYSRVATPDSSGGGRDFETFNGGLDLASPGRFGNYYSESNTSPLVTGPGADHPRVTLIAWARADSFNPNARVIAGRSVNGVTCQEMAYALRSEGGDTMSGASFSIRRPDGSGVSSPVYPGFADNRWHMLAGVFDGSSVRLYVDGTQVGTGTPTGTAAIGYNGGSFGIGGYVGSGCPDADFPGGIDEVREYSRALSATEIARLAAPAATSPPVLVPDQSAPPKPPAPPAPPKPPPPPKPFALFSSVSGTTGGTRPKPGLNILDASRTTNATVLRWDLNGDGKPDLECPSSQPYLILHSNASSRLQVSLIAEGPGGSTKYSKSIAPDASGAGSLGAAESAVCAASPQAFLQKVPPPKTCGNQNVIFGLVDAQSCFTRESDVRDIPSAERSVVRSHYESERFSPTVVIICNQAKAGKRPQADCDKAKATFKERLFDAYVTKRSVKVNGVTITPKNGASVVVYPSLERVISSRAVMVWGGMRVKLVPGPIDLNLKSNVNVIRTGKPKPGTKVSIPDGQAKLLSFDGKKDLPAIDGFRLNGQVDLVLKKANGKRSSVGTLRLTLPPIFTLFGGKPPSAETSLAASNSGGPVIDHIKIKVPQADFKTIKITDLSFEYRLSGGIDGDRNPGTSCDRKEWKARGNVFLLGKKGQAGFKLTPPPSQNGIGFCRGGFKHFGGALIFGGPIPKPQLFPGILLDEVNFAVQLKPVLIRGGGQFSAVDVAKVRGALLLAFATPREPYKLTANDGPELRPLGDRFLTSPTLAVGGNVALSVPGVGDVPLASGAMMYSYPDYIAVNGSARFVVPGMAIYGAIAGQASVNRRLYSFYGGVKACLGGIKGGGCLGGDAWVTNRGAVACLSILDTLHPGAGFYWRGRVTVWPFDGCKPSRYWVNFAAASVSQVGGGASFRVVKGEKLKNVKLVGRGGAPLVRVTGPTGQRVDVTGDEFQVAPDKSMLGIRQNESETTYIGVKGRPGTYRVDLLPGSAAIADVSASRPGYDTDFSAKVTGKGAKRTLVYDARKKGGQKVTFFERGRNVFHRIGSSTGGKGKIRFTPAQGAGGTRQIVTTANLDGTPIPNQTLARFRVAGTPRTGRPRAVRVKRRGRTLSISWKKARGAVAYGVVVEYANGTQRHAELGPKRRTLRVRGVPLEQGGAVRVSARGFFGDYGRPGGGRFKRLARPFTMLQTATDNEKRRAAKRTRGKRRTAKRR